MLCWLPPYQSVVLIFREDGEISDTNRELTLPSQAGSEGKRRLKVCYLPSSFLPSFFPSSFFFCLLDLPSPPPSLLQWFPLEPCSESLTPHAPCVWFLLVIWNRPLRAFSLGTGAVKAEMSFFFFTTQPSSLSLSHTHTHAHTGYLIYKSTAAPPPPPMSHPCNQGTRTTRNI